MKCECGYYAKGTSCFCCGKMVKIEAKETKIKPVSKNLAADQREYSKLRKKFLEENPVCRVFPQLKATTVHHSRGRGKYLLDVSTWVACSMEGHTKIENYPIWAREEGFTKSRLT
jgi:hypothetical protein